MILFRPKTEKCVAENKLFLSPKKCSLWRSHQNEFFPIHRYFLKRRGIKRKRICSTVYMYNSLYMFIKLAETDFESGHDSTILVREGTRGIILEGAHQKRNGFYSTDRPHQ